MTAGGVHHRHFKVRPNNIILGGVINAMDSTDTTYDLNNRITSIRFNPTGSSALPQVMTYTNDADGNVSAVVSEYGEVLQNSHYYPYGTLMDESFGEDEQPYLWGGKELENIGAIAEYDFEARSYSAKHQTFNQQDPLYNHRPWHSPYVYCGADPVNNTDPSGLRFTENAQKYYDKLLSETLSNSLLANYEYGNNPFIDVAMELYEMNKSNQLFDIQFDESLKNSSAYTTLDVDTKTIVFRFSNPNPSIDLIAHEFKHGHQAINGELDFGKNKNRKIYDIYDEYDAYNRGALFESSKSIHKVEYSLLDISLNYRYNFLPKTRLSVKDFELYNAVGKPDTTSADIINLQRYIDKNGLSIYIAGKLYTPVKR